MMRERIDGLLATYKVLSSELDEVATSLDEATEDFQNHEEARIIFQKAAQITQNNLKSQVSKIVSTAMSIVFLNEAKEFVMEFKTKRNTSECYLWFKEGDNLIHPMDSSGFGEADVASFALRVAYWALGTTRNTLIVDEPFKYLDGDRMERAAEMVEYLSDELSLQFIMNTHNEEFQGHFSKRFHVVRSKKVSTVSVIEPDMQKII